jgi:hypothetical protein
MKQKLLTNKQTAKLRGRFGRSLLGLLLCVCILISGTTFALQVIALTIPHSAAELSETQTDDGAAVSDAVASDADEIAQDYTDAPAHAAPLTAKAADLAATGAEEYIARLTDRSNDIGVKSEGYTDSPYNDDKTISNGGNVNFLHYYSPNKQTGGTFQLTGNKATITAQFWDGKKPFRVTSADGNNGREVEFTNTSDFSLEDDIVPNGAMKFDHVFLSSLLSSENLFARGNKLVIGEGITTESNVDWRIYGGSDYAQDIYLSHTNGFPEECLTNVVVADGNWNDVFGGGKGSTGRGTQVTIRGNANVAANVANVYGGGEYRGSIGLKDQSESKIGDGINVYIEGGTVGSLWGGNQINHYTTTLGLISERFPLPIYEDIHIDVTGGHVDRLIAGSDCTDSSTNTLANLSDSAIHGNATVNISAADSVGSVAGDPNRNATSGRQILGVTQLNVSASNTFNYVDLFDVVNITGDGVVVTVNSKAGENFNDKSSLTFWDTATTHDGFIGQIRVSDGAKLILTHGGTINRTNEGDITLKATDNHTPYYLSKAWVGETDVEDRSLSTLAISGSGAGITAASGTSFNDAADTCGLRVHGDVRGYSTLEVTDTPIYSTGNDYYYYVVADSSANGGKAFREPAGADYIVCYRSLDDGRIGWYLREKPTITINNQLLRSGESSEVVMSVVMNSFGYEWSETAEDNKVDFQIDKTTGTDSAALTVVNESITLTAMAGIDNIGNFRDVVTATDSDGIKHLVSFSYVIDNSTANAPTYYAAEADYHVIGDDGYEDIHPARTADAARCVYEFTGADAVMTTFPYSNSPAGSDTAMLRVSLPYGMTGTLAVAENDNAFHFTTDSSTVAYLDASTTVTSDYASANDATADSHFGVTIGGDDLYTGVSRTLSAAVSEYPCAVYSYKNLSRYDISAASDDGLRLNLTVSGLTKDGHTVGAGNPSTVSSGELQIQTAGIYKITYRFITRTQGEKIFVVKGKLGYAEVDGEGQLTDAFVLSNAPYESNHGQNLSWNASLIVRSHVGGVLSAELAAVRTAKQVSLNYRLDPSGAYDHHAMVDIGANRESSEAVAALTVEDPNFKYWEIRKSALPAAPVYARCYDPDFSYCIMGDYWITPVLGNAAGDISLRLNPDAVKDSNKKWLAWTSGEGVDGHLVTPSDDLTFNGLSDYVTFFSVPKDSVSVADLSDASSKTAELPTASQDGKTYVLSPYSGTGDVVGHWSDTITLTHTEYTRNRWTDAEGNLTANGRSDYLYSDFEIAYRDGSPREIYGSDGYRTGIVFELCGTLGGEETFDPDTCIYKSDEANLKAAIRDKASSYMTDGASRRIQCSDIPTSNISKMNRVELGKSYYNTNTNANAIMKVTAYLVDKSDNSVTLSNPVYICLREVSQRNLAISVDG